MLGVLSNVYGVSPKMRVNTSPLHQVLKKHTTEGYFEVSIGEREAVTRILHEPEAGEGESDSSVVIVPSSCLGYRTCSGEFTWFDGDKHVRFNGM